MITVAIPFYNAEKYLALAIESVRSQTLETWKLILLDDGSTDGSLAIAKHFEETDERISVFSDGANKNLGFRLNQIPQLTDTEYLARMDADDIMHPERLKKQLDTLKQNPQIDVLGTNAFSINEEGKVVGIRMNPEGKPRMVKVKGFIHPTIMAKTEWFRQNPYDVGAVRIEDAELWLRTAGRSNFYCLTEPLLYYREFGDHYYKKYFKAFPSLMHLLQKYYFTPTVLFFGARYVISAFRAYFMFAIGLEDKMLLERNEVKV